MAGINLYFPIDTTFTGTNGVTMIINPARTWDFGTGITDLSALKAKILELFHLDELLIFTANYGGITYHGFWGLVIPGGFNANMRKAERLIEVNIPNSTATRVILNDAGLNTYGFASGLTLLSDLGNGGAKISASYKSAYFHDSSYYLWVKRGSEVPALIFLKTVTRNSTSSDSNRVIDLFNTYDVHAGQTLSIKVISSNSEGWWEEMTAQSITIQPYAKDYKYGTTPKSSFEAPGLTEVWLGSYRPDLGTVFYAHIGMGARMPAGYYMNTDNDDYYEVDTNGEVTSKNTYVPDVPLNYLAYGTRISTGSDFGDYEVRVRIINDQIAAQLSSVATIKLGMLINPAGDVTEANMSVQATHVFSAISVPALDESDRTQTGSVALPYAGSTWAYVLIVDGNELSNGIFMI